MVPRNVGLHLESRKQCCVHGGCFGPYFTPLAQCGNSLWESFLQPFFYVVLDLLLYFGWDELANIWDVVLFDSGERRQIGGSVTYAEFRFLEFSVVGEGQELCR